MDTNNTGGAVGLSRPAPKYKIEAREFGRGRPSVNRFRSLDGAQKYIADRYEEAGGCGYRTFTFNPQAEAAS